MLIIYHLSQQIKHLLCKIKNILKNEIKRKHVNNNTIKVIATVDQIGIYRGVRHGYKPNERFNLKAPSGRELSSECETEGECVIIKQN